MGWVNLTTNYFPMNKDRIYITDWLALKPYDTQTLTDSYYLKLSNRVKQAMLSGNESAVLFMYFDDEDLNLLACFFTAWFEDLISGTNIWNSFVRQHKHLYKKPLPFFPAEDYYEEEINPQDVSFLIWYYMNTAQDDKFISPYNDFILTITKRVYPIFEEAWEYAPENKVLHQIYSVKPDADYYQARTFTDTLLFKSYLFYPDTFYRLLDNEADIIEEYGEDENLVNYLNENRETTLQNSATRLLALKGKDWVAEIIGEKHPLQQSYANLSRRIRGFFLYKGQDDTDIFLEHIASGKRFNLTKKSFDNGDDLREIDTILFIGIVQWENEWWFSGIYYQHEFNADLVLDEKNSFESRGQVNFLDQDKKEMKETLEQQYKAFIEFNNDSPIAFMSAGKLEDFAKKFFSYFNDSLNLSEKEIEEARERSRKAGFLKPDEESAEIDFSENAKSGLVFFNPKSGLEMALSVNSAFPLPENPFFEEVNSEDHIFSLLMDQSISTELAMFCIENCSNKLSFFTEGVGKLYLNDIDFLIRFWKGEKYFSVPRVTAIGND